MDDRAEVELVTVGRFNDAVAAELARAKLESAGIPAHLADELTVSIDWQLTNALGGIRVQVVPEEAQAAQAILRANPTAVESADAKPLREPLNPREAQAERAATCALFGCLFPPLLFYAAWLICRVLATTDELRPTVRRQFRFALVVGAIGAFCVFPGWLYAYLYWT